MDSVYEKTGAKKVYGVSMNQIYATLVAAMGAGMFGIATDKKAWVFKDAVGDEYKALTDATGASAIPNTAVIVADSNGHATGAATFTYSGTALRVPNPFTFEFGDQTVDGSFRIRINSGIFFEVRESGAWREMGAML